MKKFLFAALLALSPMAAQAQCGQASYYGPGLHGGVTANGERFDQYAMTAAHPYQRLNSYVNVTHNGKTIRVKISDRGPYTGGRVLDLSYGAFAALASPSRGVINVCIAKS
jgi:rare lipoprotein A